MDMSLWTTEDYLLAGELGLDLPDAQPNGQFGDLKVDHDLSSSASLRDAVGGTMSEWSPSQEEDVGFDWMESSDLGSYLDVLDGSEEQLLPIESTLYELKASPPTESSFTQITEKEDLVSFGQIDFSDHHDNVIVETVKSASPAAKADVQFWFGGFDAASTTVVASFDALVSPPSSPVQVTPVIKLEESPVEVEVEESISPPPSWDVPLDDGTAFDRFLNQDLILNELDTFNSIAHNSYVDLEDARQLISSPLSVDDVEDTLASSSFSSPSSPEVSNNSDDNSIIKTCPELYKVISTSSIQLSGSSRRFSPYQKSKTANDKADGTKSAGKSGGRRSPAKPVPEHVIVQQVNKKDRKKLQNKNAAIRYRMKKKEEAKGIKSEVETLEDINTDLKNKVEDLEREVKYMKNLMEEVYKAKGIIKNEK